MTLTEFNQRIAATNMDTRSRTALACWSVLVYGFPPTLAAKEQSISLPAVSKGLKRLLGAVPRESCPKCGQSL